jgi:LmbE family N-acetylglucosaminyl deacetylase
MKRNVLVIVAHSDDEILGCGGTMIKHVKAGDEVSVLILSSQITSRNVSANEPNISKQAAETSKQVSKMIGYDIYFQNFRDQKFDTYPILNITKVIEEIINILKPNVIYTHNCSDLNKDHRITFEAVMTATRPCSHQVNEIYSFEIVSSTEWQAPQLQTFKPNYFNEFDKNIMELKLKALECYKNEIKCMPHPRSTINILNKAEIWASVAVTKSYCEAFEIIRIINRS